MKYLKTFESHDQFYTVSLPLNKDLSVNKDGIESEFVCDRNIQAGDKVVYCMG